MAAALTTTVLFAGPSAGGSDQSRITLFARPTTIAWAQSIQLFGAAPGARPGEIVEIEAKECGVPAYQTLAEVHAGSGGGWSIRTGLLLTTTFRAVFEGRRSNEVTVRQAPLVVLERERRGRDFLVTVTARKSFWRKGVVIQRRTRSGWVALRRVVLTDSLSLSGTLSATEATFPLRVPKGTVVRAVVPLAQARPCYVAGLSRAVRT